jgi:Cytochrome P460
VISADAGNRSDYTKVSVASDANVHRYHGPIHWGYAVFRYDVATDTFTPGTAADQPPQANDAKCGVACHTIVKANDYVFPEYGHR